MSDTEDSCSSEKEEVDLGSEDTEDESSDEDEDVFTDEDTGKKVTLKEIHERDKEAFEMFHRILYGMYRPSIDYGKEEEEEEVRGGVHSSKPEEKKKKKKPVRQMGSSSGKPHSARALGSGSGSESDASTQPPANRAASLF